MQTFDHTSGEFLEIDDAKIYYEMKGKSTDPVLLFLHGALGSMAHFNSIISELPAKYRILGIDCRGQGKSTLGSQDLSYALMQSDIEKVLAHLKIDRLSLIGFSNGGTVAYRLATFSNLKIDKICTIGAPWHTEHLKHLQGAYSQLTSNYFKLYSPSVFDDYMTLNPDPDFDTLFKKAIKMGLDNSSTGRPNELVQNISCPTLILRGEEDPIVSHANNVELTKLIKNSQTFSITLAGHEVCTEQPQAVLHHLNEFLTQK